MTLNINLNDYIEFDNGYYPVIGASRILYNTEHLIYTPKLYTNNINRFFFKVNSKWNF